jgi:tRNA A37 threonylcarbamoyladenosine modification protein TsaB
VILVIDTSSARSAVALLGPRGDVVAEELADSGRTFSVSARVRAITAGQTITTVMVATGPGSFTGLRSGVSFGLGLAIGLRIPICPLSTLALQAARSDTPVTALAEAGRGRVYHLPPGGEPAVGEASDVDGDLPAVGWLRPSTEAALRAAGVALLDPAQLRTFGGAAATLVGSAREVAYGSLKLEYMYGISAPSPQG